MSRERSALPHGGGSMPATVRHVGSRWSRPCVAVCRLLLLVLALAFTWSARAEAFIYWGQAPPPPNHSPFSMGRANLDGTGINRSFIPNTAPCGGIAINDQHVFWGNSPGVGRANVDGSSPTSTFINSSGKKIRWPCIDSSGKNIRCRPSQVIMLNQNRTKNF